MQAFRFGASPFVAHRLYAIQPPDSSPRRGKLRDRAARAPNAAGRHRHHAVSRRQPQQRREFDRNPPLPATVNVNQFGKQFSTPVDGQVYSQPLYVPNLSITSGPQQGVHNVVFVATEHDSLYAIDAHGGNILWKRSFQSVEDPTIANGTATLVNPLGATLIAPMPAGKPAAATSPSRSASPRRQSLTWRATRSSWSPRASRRSAAPTTITSRCSTRWTSAAGGDRQQGDCRYRDTGSGYTHRITDTGTGTDPYVIGTGYQGEAVNVSGQSRIYFNAKRQMNRPGLILDHGTLYTAWASHGDNGPYHGWVLGFDPSTLALTGVLNTTPNGGLGGIWEGGGITATDAAGNLYFETGNGTFDGFNTNGVVTGLDANKFPANADYGDTFMKVSVDPSTTQTNQNRNGWGLKVADYFSPFNNHQLDGADTDLGSGGLTILPDAVGSTAHPHLLIGAARRGSST